MSRKNFKVATTQEGKTTLTKIDKTPTGKVKTLKDKEAVKKAREEQYENFRTNALIRRAKRMGLSEEQIKVKIEELKKQLAAPTNYSVLIWYNPEDFDMMKEALKNEDMTVDILTTTYLFITVDSEGLATLRSIAPSSAKIYPYVKRKPPILPTQQPSVAAKKGYRTKAEKKALAKAAKKARKNKTVEEDSRRGLMCFRKRVNEMRKSKLQRKQEKEARKKDEKLKGITRKDKKAYTGPFTGKTAKEKKAISASMKAHRANIKKVEKARMKNFTKTRVFRKNLIVMHKDITKPLETKEKASTELKQAA